MPTPPPAATPVDPPPRPPVSRRDLEVLRLLAAGRSTAAIATAMSISTNTVRTHVHHLQHTLGAPARDEVVPRARTLGLLAAGDAQAASGA